MENIIIISEEDRNTVQRADIECSARMHLISFIMQSNVNLDNQRFKDYQNEYIIYFEAFEKAKKDLEMKYLMGKTYSSWFLNYSTCELKYDN